MDSLQHAFSAQLQHRLAHHGYASPEEAYFECENCGPIVPYHVKLSGRWLKGTCECMIKARQERELAEMRMAWMRAQPKRSYEWLGSQWSDMPLVEKTFENFESGFQDAAVESVDFFLDDMHGSLILHSEGYGTGKTHLLAAIVTACV